LLLEHLAVHARRHGITELVGEILPSNAPMLRVARDLGRPAQSTRGLDLVEVQLTTDGTVGEVMDVRDLSAARRSLEPLFSPKCLAVVGAGRSPGGIGHTILRAVVDGHFQGEVYAVNPSADHVAGVPAYPSIAAAPTRPDLVVIAVPAPAVAAVLTDAAAA